MNSKGNDRFLIFRTRRTFAQHFLFFINDISTSWQYHEHVLPFRRISKTDFDDFINKMWFLYGLGTLRHKTNTNNSLNWMNPLFQAIRSFLRSLCDLNLFPWGSNGQSDDLFYSYWNLIWPFLKKNKKPSLSRPHDEIWCQTKKIDCRNRTNQKCHAYRSKVYVDRFQLK